MRLKNTTDFPDLFLWRMIQWCCIELDLPVGCVNKVTFRNRSGPGRYSGHCHSSTGEIVVSIITAKSTGVFYQLPSIVDRHDLRIDCLVRVTGHELAHRLLWLAGAYSRRSKRYGTVRRSSSEKHTKVYEDKVMAAFWGNRKALLEEWYGG